MVSVGKVSQTGASADAESGLLNLKSAVIPGAVEFCRMEGVVSSTLLPSRATCRRSELR